MINFEKIKLKNISIHFTGNKLSDEGIKLSRLPSNFDNQIKDILLKYFLTSFKTEEYYNLHHESDLGLNEVYNYVSGIFDDIKVFHKQSVNLAKHLYEQSTHPKIKGGEFYVVYFSDCIINDEQVDAVGLFKSESKDTFLKVLSADGNFEINYEEGININKLDKGCLIFNTERDKGYIVAIVDNTGKGTEAQYWKDAFLHLRPREDSYHQTQNLLRLCKGFVTERLPEAFEVSKADQVDLLNKSVKFFKENDSFDLNDFTNEVLEEPQKIRAFRDYREQFQTDKEINISDEFDISESAVKKQARVFKSVLKLDKNFHIYIHGNRELIEQGIDKDGRKYYKIYYNEET